MSIEEDFLEFDSANPRVRRLFMRSARRLQIVGFTQYPARLILNRIQWTYDIRYRRLGALTIPTEFIDLYAQVAIEQRPGLFTGFFGPRTEPAGRGGGGGRR